MGRGLPKKYAKMGFKEGWKAYKASKKSSKTTTKKRKGKVTKRRSYRKKRRRRKSKAVPLAIVIPAIAPLIEAATNDQFASNIREGDPFGAAKCFMNIASMRYTGYSTYDHTWNIARAMPTWGSMLVGLLVHKTVGKYANQYMKRIPLIGKYLAI